MIESVSILGSTGSIGKQAVDVCKDKNIRITGICAGNNINELEKQIRELHPKICGVEDGEAGKRLKIAVADTDTKVVYGTGACESVAENDESDTSIVAVSGIAGLKPTVSAIKSGKKRIALANKESLVTAGGIVKNEIKKRGTELIPVDSEHSAIFQCLNGQRINKIILTASGGPFFGKTRDYLKTVTPETALAHPTWNMGRRITVDSATMMNKGFEVIEAIRLFDVKPDEVEVVVHRESVVHSMVEYADGAVIAQLGCPDMRLPIQYALTYPQREESSVKHLDFLTLSTLSFFKPDVKTFSLLALAYKAYERGGFSTAYMNAADEVCVKAFLDGKIGFTDIFEIVEKVTLLADKDEPRDIDDVINADITARRITDGYINDRV